MNSFYQEYMGKSFIILALLSLSICQGCSNKQQVGAKAHQGKARTYDSTPRRSDSTNENRQSLKKYALKTFRRYQTFDEFKMKGVGKHKYSPFVYVKTTKDTIIVIPSNDTTHVKVYYRHGNRWCNHMELELWKKRQPFTKSSLEEPARTYDRICGNDTILEYQCNYLGNTKYKQFYIKTPKRCVNIKLIGEIDFVSGNHTVYNEMLMFAHMFNHERKKLLAQHGRSRYDKREVYSYSLQDKAHAFVYQCRERNETLYFSKTSLGIFGIQPGIEKYDRERSQVAGY